MRAIPNHFKETNVGARWNPVTWEISYSCKRCIYLVYSILRFCLGPVLWIKRVAISYIFHLNYSPIIKWIHLFWATIFRSVFVTLFIWKTCLFYNYSTYSFLGLIILCVIFIRLYRNCAFWANFTQFYDVFYVIYISKLR